ncbi:MAG: NAD(+) kinase [Peptococcaceae bacterium]|nr:MAG: NAD(+) kinase [Peptococcaceae bacterium]
MRTVGLMINLEKEGILELVGQIVSLLEEEGCTVLIEEETAGAVGIAELGVSQGQLISLVDWVIVLGGDGTLLSCARQFAAAGTPIIGINVGRLGFLTEIDVPGMKLDLKRILNGHYYIEERMMLEAEVFRQGKVVEQSVGLNDAVITKGAFARLILLEVFINEQYLNTYPADGLIVASPTGSTAYSLSAGGPLVAPNLELILLTPICPHTLWSRPIVVASDSNVKVNILSRLGGVMLTMDGQHGFWLEQGDQVVIKRALHNTRLLRLKGRSFFEVLREKLREDDRSNG